MKKITKSAAKKAYNDGKTIFLIASKMRLNSPWSSPMSYNSKTMKDVSSFDSLVNSFSYYNCSNETGKTVHFYIK